jgi:hypothetical protein
VRFRANNELRWGLSALLVASGGAALASHPLFVAVAGNRRAYELGTGVLLAIAALVTVVWPRGDEPQDSRRPRLWSAAVTVGAGVVLLFWVAFRLLPAVFAGPPDPTRGDMLVIIEHAIARLLQGQSPYAVHHVPWDAPLSYGPLLWLPHVFPYLLRMDFRILTLAAQFVIPFCCFLAAGIRAGQGDARRAALLFGLGAGTALHPGLMEFHQIGHTQVYWPLLPVLCLLLQQKRWTPAAICLGALTSARTPMLALAPVFFLYLRAMNARTVNRMLAFGAAVLLPYLPFLLVDAHAVKNGVFDTYVTVMKGYVWRSTDWAVATYGVTGRLLQYGLERYVEVVQLFSLGLVYVTAKLALARGSRVEPWLAMALLVFAMTTLWSVIYLYFDVWLLLVSALVVYDGSWSVLSLRRPVSAGACATLGSSAIVLLAAGVHPGAAYVVDIGAPAATGYTGAGFGSDVTEHDDGRGIVWVEGATARIRVPRAGWSGATLRLGVKPYIAGPGAHQSVMASLNGRVLGRTVLQPGWQEISFRSRRRDWLYGFNVLELSFAYAAAAPGISNVSTPSGEPRELSAAVDFLRIE